MIIYPLCQPIYFFQFKFVLVVKKLSNPSHEIQILTISFFILKDHIKLLFLFFNSSIPIK